MSALRGVWGMPVLLGVCTTVGLVAGLLGDGMWDWVSVCGLAAPVGVALWHMAKPVSRRR